MRVSFVDFPLAYKKIKKEMDPVIHGVLGRGDLILRKDVEEFEKNLADYLGVKYAIGVNSGTDALTLSLRALGIGPGHEVIVPGHTFFATVEAVINVGATPVIVDVGPDLLIDPESVKNALTPKTRAIIPVHLAGAVCDMKFLMKMALIYNLHIVEDACQALGATYNGLKAGSMGNTGCFSFYPAKILGAYGDAGAIVTNSLMLAERLCLLRNHGGKPYSLIPGCNSRLDNLQAAVLNVKLKHLNEWIYRRTEIAWEYEKGLKKVEGMGLPPFSPGRVYQDYIVHAKDRRDELYEALKKDGIETIPDIYGFPQGYWQPSYAKYVSQNFLRLPIAPELTNAQIKHVIKSIKKFYVGKG